MKAFLTVLTVFAALTAYSQMDPGNDSMDAQIRRGLALQPDQNVLTIRQEKPDEIKRGCHLQRHFCASGQNR